MQGRKRFLAALLCLCALLMALPQSALAAETGESGFFDSGSHSEKAFRRQISQKSHSCR